MKFLHLADLHLGRSLGEFDLIEDQKYMIEELLKLIEREAVGAVLIAGDVYDKAIPSEAATRLLDDFLCRLAAKKVRTFMISGNHDSDERLHYGSTLFEANQIFIATKYEGSLYKQTIKEEQGEIDVYLLPFVKASQVRHYLPEAEIHSYEDAVRAILANEKIDPARCNVLVAHQFVMGKGEEPAFGGSEGLATQSVGLVEKIGYDCFQAFDYVALGHIHSPQRVGRKQVRYAGSPLKYSLSEVNNEKSVPIVTVQKKGEVEIRLHPVRPMRDVRHIRGRMEELLEKDNLKAVDDFIYVTLTDEERIDNAMGIFQQYYPNTVKLDYDNSHTREIEQIDLSQIARNKSFSELISDFYRQIYGCEISEEEKDIMRQVAREAGVISETG